MRLLRLVPFLSGVVALCLMLGPGAAYAQEEAEEKDDFGRTGFYIGVGGALTQMMVVEDRIDNYYDDDPAVDVGMKSSFGVNGRVGYRFHLHLAAELEADWHPSVDAEVDYGVEQLHNFTYEPLVFTTNMKGYLFGDRFQPYAVVGVGVMAMHEEGKPVPGSESHPSYLSPSSRWLTGFAARFGGGVDMYITEHIVLNAEIRYVLPTGAADGFDLISFGWALQYRF